MLINQSTKEITSKIVYYGPALSGKTTNIQYLHEYLDPEIRGKLLTISTEGDRTIFFDFMPIELGEVKGFKLRLQLYTVPGQVFYEETRKRVLKGADGVVFVADSQKEMLKANKEAFEQMKFHLSENGLNPDKTPIVLQFNKRDLKDILTFEELDKALNPGNIPFFEAIATEGVGVEDTLRSISKLVVNNILNQLTETQKLSKPGGSKPTKDFYAMDTKKLLNELGAAPKKKKSAEALFVDEPNPIPAAVNDTGQDLVTADSGDVLFDQDAGETNLLQNTGDEPLMLDEQDEVKTEEADTGDYSGLDSAISLSSGKKIKLPVEIGGKKYTLILELKAEE